MILFTGQLELRKQKTASSNSVGRREQELDISPGKGFDLEGKSHGLNAEGPRFNLKQLKVGTGDT